MPGSLGHYLREKLLPRKIATLFQKLFPGRARIIDSIFLSHAHPHVCTANGNSERLFEALLQFNNYKFYDREQIRKVILVSREKVEPKYL